MRTAPTSLAIALLLSACSSSSPRPRQPSPSATTGEPAATAPRVTAPAPAPPAAPEAPPAPVTPPAPEVPPLSWSEVKQRAEALALHFDGDWLQFIGHPGFVAPVVDVAGGYLLVGDRAQSGGAAPVAILTDGRGAVRWETSLAHPKYRAFEAAGGAALPDGGFVAVIASYPHPARNPVTRVVKLDGQGAIVWDVVTRGDGTTRSPQLVRAEVTASGAVTLGGWLYQTRPASDGSTPLYPWRGELSPQGAFVVDEVAAAPLPRDDRSHLVFAVEPLWRAP